jgi:hypothetical protein
MSRPYVRHALTPILNAARALDDNWIDALGDVGTALRAWRTDLIHSLGGEATVSTQERAVIELASKTYLLLESVDRWLLAQPSLIHKKRRALFPIVLQRQQLADSLSRYMGQLGLQRRSPKSLDLARALGTGAPNGTPRAKDGEVRRKRAPGHARTRAPRPPEAHDGAQAAQERAEGTP